MMAVQEWRGTQLVEDRSYWNRMQQRDALLSWSVSTFQEIKTLTDKPRVDFFSHRATVQETVQGY